MQMSYGICRIKKLKAGNLKASAQHTQRKRFTPNADPDKEHICIIGEDAQELETLVKDRIGKQTIRKNGVLAVEILLSASPEYFRPDDKSEAGYYEQARLADFQTTARQWLIERYGDRIVRAELHLDEATPHIHAYLVPLDERGKLNCRGLFGTRSKLSQLQDSYAQAMSELGLERGIKGSRATHTQIKQYYTAVTQEANLTLDEAGIQHQLADRGRILKENKEIKLTAKSLVQKLGVLDYRNLELELQTDNLKQETQLWKDKYLDLANLDANYTQNIPLSAVAYELGLSPIEGKQDLWHNHDNVLKITDTTFSTLSPTQPKEGSNALDLVMTTLDCDFTEAVIWLNDRFGSSVASQSVDLFTKEVIKTAPVPKFTPPTCDEKGWQQVRNHLLDELKVASKVVDKLHREGLIYADGKQNLVSIRRNLDKFVTGASLKGTLAGAGNKFTSLSTGSKRSGGWFYFESSADINAPIERVVLVNSPLEALSLASLEQSPVQKTIYLSLEETSQLPLEFLRSLPPKSVLIALNNNPSSKKLAHLIRQQLPKQTVFKRPRSIDWNTELVKSAYWQQQGEYTQNRGVQR
jgi:Plasmid recombination enzyme